MGFCLDEPYVSQSAAASAQSAVNFLSGRLNIPFSGQNGLRKVSETPRLDTICTRSVCRGFSGGTAPPHTPVPERQLLLEPMTPLPSQLVVPVGCSLTWNFMFSCFDSCFGANGCRRRLCHLTLHRLTFNKTRPLQVRQPLETTDVNL